MRSDTARAFLDSIERRRQRRNWWSVFFGTLATGAFLLAVAPNDADDSGDVHERPIQVADAPKAPASRSGPLGGVLLVGASAPVAAPRGAHPDAIAAAVALARSRLASADPADRAAGVGMLAADPLRWVVEREEAAGIVAAIAGQGGAGADRVVALRAAGRFPGDAACLLAIQGGLAEDEPGVLAAAAMAAGAAGLHASRDRLVALADHEDDGVCVEAAVALARLGDSRGPDLLVALCGESDDPSVVVRALRGLSGDPRVADVARAELADQDDPVVTATAALELTALGQPVTREEMEPLLGAGGAWQLHALYVLWRSGDAGAAAELLGLLRDPSTDPHDCGAIVGLMRPSTIPSHPPEKNP